MHSPTSQAARAGSASRKGPQSLGVCFLWAGAAGQEWDEIRGGGLQRAWSGDSFRLLGGWVQIHPLHRPSIHVLGVYE